ncbi:nuclear-pore anchor isoform X2 [Nymphaea colorata]|uniref:nuclear-pore anchor isoform X2 n=1 Tax=Nymphaea colorata TaxID=210225 RepID=UPI00129DD9D7|nr:nuclear-pore anchor isoform X2 [Nymphaea colorata]
MPLFITDEDLRSCGDNAALVAEKADAYIRELQRQLETCKSQADAAAITYEQSCALVEQKYVTLSSDYAQLEARTAQLSAALDEKIQEVARIQSEKHQLNLKDVTKDSEIEKLSLQVSEMHKSKRQLLEMIDQKDIEINDRAALAKSYLDKIINLTDDANLKDAKFHDCEAELARCQAAHARVLQEKELLERHNQWLNEELTSKVDALLELRRSSTENEADLSFKLAEVEKQLNETSRCLSTTKERMKDLEEKLTSTQEELCCCKNAAASNEQQFSAEIATATKLVELYKESTEEWSKKAAELEGVIKALETHLSQVEDEFKEKLNQQVSEKNGLEKEASELREKLNKCELELENARKANELDLPMFSLSVDHMDTGERNADLCDGGEKMLVPRIPIGVSGTALAAALLRDGWSLAKMYAKYQETVDALRHEKLGRKQSQAILEKVLSEIEEKAEIVLEERAEHEKMVEAYNVLENKLQKSLSDQAIFENSIRELKVELRRHERDLGSAEKEITDLESQVTILLKECHDIQLRCGVPSTILSDNTIGPRGESIGIESRMDNSPHLMPFKNINGLVEQNVKLRGRVHSLEHQKDEREAELKEVFEMEMRKREDEAASKVAIVLSRAEEQGHMIESLHTAVGMYKRLYEEELKRRGGTPNTYTEEHIPEVGWKENYLNTEISQDANKKGDDKSSARIKDLEEDLLKARNEVASLQLERDKLVMEAKFEHERFERFLKEFEDLRKEVTAMQSRNVELSQLIIDHQRRLRESSQSVQSSEELSRKMSMQVSALQHEKDLLLNSEKRALDEVRALSERAHRLQASLDAFHSIEEVRENARIAERRKLEGDLQRVQKEWAEAKQELQDERKLVQNLTRDREQTVRTAMQQVEDMRKELAEALRNVASAEARASISETRCIDLEARLKRFENLANANAGPGHPVPAVDDDFLDIDKMKEEMRSLREEAQSSKEHMLQFKEIAQVNEEALKQIEVAHNSFKAEAEKIKTSLESEIVSLRERISELESNLAARGLEFSSTISEKDAALSSALTEISSLKEKNSALNSQKEELEIWIASLKDDLEREHQRWRSAQDNYERQVLLQSEAIQELRKTSDALTALQVEAAELRKQADSLRTENEILKRTWETEKVELQKLKDEAELKYIEINEQNNILLNRLGAVNVQIAEERTLSCLSAEGSVSETKGEGDLQTVINYLRRSKEIAETEISLLKQERLRLQTQLESALKASETAQSMLQAERANTRSRVYSDEEFQSLQLQVREINLLRDSNVQLRAENQHNFEECQKANEVAQKAKSESDHLATLLREKEVELEAVKKQVDMQKEEIGLWEKRNSEIVSSYKNLDMEDYEQMKENFKDMQEKLKTMEVELQESQSLLVKKKENVSDLEQEIANKELKLNEMQKQLQDVTANVEILKSKEQKQKHTILHWKRRTEELSREKDELFKEKQAISKQLEESRAVGKRSLGEAAKQHEVAARQELAAHHDQALKEKDTRIQSLEKILERAREDLQKERDELRREKAVRVKDRKTFMELAQKSVQAKKELEEKLDKHKHQRESLIESGVPTTVLPSDVELDEKMTNYLQCVDQVEEAANLLSSDVLASQSVSSSISVHAESVPGNERKTGRLVGAVSSTTHPVYPPASVHPPQIKDADEKTDKSNVPKPVAETRKPGRKLIRPQLGEDQAAHPSTREVHRERSEPASEILPSLEQSEHVAETEVAEMETESNLEEGRSVAINPELSNEGMEMSGRKRVLDSSSSDLQEGFVHQDAKKPKHSDSSHEDIDGGANKLSDNPDLPLSGPDAIAPESNEPEIFYASKAGDMEIENEPAMASVEAVVVSDLETANVEPGDAVEALDGPVDADDSFEGGNVVAKDTPVAIDEEREEGEFVSDSAQDIDETANPEQSQTPSESCAAGSDAEDEPEGTVNMKNTEVTSSVLTDDPKEVATSTPTEHSTNDTPALLQDPVASGASDTSDPNVKKQASPGEVSESKDRETSTGRTVINIPERARMRAIARSSGIASSPSGRGRGRTSRGSLKKDTGAGRGGRGARR